MTEDARTELYTATLLDFLDHTSGTEAPCRLPRERLPSSETRAELVGEHSAELDISQVRYVLCDQIAQPADVVYFGCHCQFQSPPGPTYLPQLMLNELTVGLSHLPDNAFSDVVSLGSDVPVHEDSRTDPSVVVHSQIVEQQIRAIFSEACPDEFEDGSPNMFAEQLSSAILKFSNTAIIECDHLITHQVVHPAAAAEALKVIGDMDHDTTYKFRKSLLLKAISKSSSPIIRNGANTGLALMDDPDTISCVADAIEKEPSALLRRLMSETLKQLENTHKCLSISE